MLHYVACLYDHLLKTKAASIQGGLPPVFPIVVYNGTGRWHAQQDIYEMIQPEPPCFLQAYQPHLRYYLIDEGRYSEADLAQRQSPLSGVFGIENAVLDRAALQRAVERIVILIQASPDKERMDKILTRWLKRHLHWLGARVELDSLTEEREMLAENLRTWAEREREEGRMEEARRILSRQLCLKFGELPDWAAERLDPASAEQLESWAMAILQVDSLEALFER